MYELRLASPQAVASCRPFIYVGFSREEHVCYVGQTLDKRGVLGRWIDHLSRDRYGSSFRRRLDDHDELSFARISDFTVVAWELGSRVEFVSTDRQYREAVEYLVQQHVRTNGHLIQPFLRVISTVRTNPTAALDFVEAQAQLIAQEFTSFYALAA